MSKFSKGDIVDLGCAVGQIKEWRGGNVAPYVVEILQSSSSLYKVNEIVYKSGRDMRFKENQNMNCQIELGDYVRDAINGYKGVVFGIEPDGDKTYIHFKRTNKDLYGNRFGNETNRINAKNIEILSKGDCPMPKVVPQSKLALERKLDLLLEHLGLEIVVEPARMQVQAIEVGSSDVSGEQVGSKKASQTAPLTEKKG